MLYFSMDGFEKTVDSKSIDNVKDTLKQRKTQKKSIGFQIIRNQPTRILEKLSHFE